jgi:hypothetical protein
MFTYLLHLLTAIFTRRRDCQILDNDLLTSAALKLDADLVALPVLILYADIVAPLVLISGACLVAIEYLHLSV